MSGLEHLDESARDELLSGIREDPLGPQAMERVRLAVEASYPTVDIASAVYAGLEGVLATYWVALQEGKLQRDDGDFYKVLGMRRYVRTCHQDRERLRRFLDAGPDFFEMLGRMTSWQH